MERALYFSKFRNIGLEKPERIVLNKSLNKGEIGNLVIVVGANNSGKSNVLDGLMAFGNKKIEERDITNLSFEDSDRKPELSLVCKDEEIEYHYGIEKGKKDPFIKFPQEKNVGNGFSFMEYFEKTKQTIYDFFMILQNSYNGGATLNLLNNLLLLLDGDIKESKEIEEKIIYAFSKYFETTDKNYPSIWDNFVNREPSNLFVQDMNKLRHNIKPNYFLMLENSFEEKYHFSFMPKIVIYKEKQISNSDIQCNINSLSSNEFFKGVFEKIDFSLSQIENAYRIFHEQANKGVLRTLERQINVKLEKLSNDFNNLYFASDDEYRFEISLESDKLYFSLFRGEYDISLNYQSTGFRWFFNLYFTLLSNNELKSGDIIIMDEPATNLHVSGQKELRKFLKDFAIKNDLTIVLATHSPFLIDLDYLDEIRVVSMKDNKTKICNDFASVDIEDHDTLKSVKTALTVNNHVLLDPDSQVVFVEGITDYNYFVTFKKLLDIKEDIVFLPINGVGNIKEPNFEDKQFEISKTLLQIKKHNAILLVDSDGAGKSMKKINKESELEVISLNDIDPNFKLIENLFDKEDLNNLRLLDSNGNYIKHTTTSATIKTFADNYKFSQNTIDNFKKVFDHLNKL